MSKLSLDSFFFGSYRRHAASVNDPPCSCDIDGPDHGCDLGYALWKCAHPKKEAQPS